MIFAQGEVSSPSDQQPHSTNNSKLFWDASAPLHLPSLSPAHVGPAHWLQYFPPSQSLLRPLTRRTNCLPSPLVPPSVNQKALNVHETAWIVQNDRSVVRKVPGRVIQVVVVRVSRRINLRPLLIKPSYRSSVCCAPLSKLHIPILWSDWISGSPLQIITNILAMKLYHPDWGCTVSHLIVITMDLITLNHVPRLGPTTGPDEISTLEHPLRWGNPCSVLQKAHFLS